MEQLKSLRPAVGTYGRVSAGGIVEVEDVEAKKLIEGGNFVKATKDDVKAAQDRQARMLAGNPAAQVPATDAAVPAAAADGKKPAKGDDAK